MKTKFKFLKLATVTILSVVINSASNASPSKVNFNDIEQTLIHEYGWTKKLIGPIGQSYRINLDRNGKSVIELHPKISASSSAKMSTPICSIFRKNRQLKFSADVYENYSHDAGNAAMKKYIWHGEEAMTDVDWLLSDKANWFRYLNEGLESSSFFKNAEELFNHTFEIVDCDTYKTTLKTGSHTITFPNLILTMPNYVLLSKDESKKTDSNAVSQLYSMLEDTGTAIAAALVFAIENQMVTYALANEIRQNLFHEDVSIENLVFAGAMCQAFDEEQCAGILIEGNDWPRGFNDYFFQARKIFGVS